MKTRLFGALLALTFSCAEKKPEAPPKAPAAEHAAKPAPPAEKRGLEAPGNDAEVVALARAALECKRDRDDPIDYQCEGYQKFRDAPKLASADATLLNFIEDADERVRWLGARALPDGFAMSPKPAYVEQPEAAARLVRAFAKEPSLEVAKMIGSKVGRIDVEKTAQLPAIAEVVKERKHPQAVRAILSFLLFTNSQSRAAFDFMLGLTRDPDDGIRQEATGAFWAGGSLSRAETCKMWEARLADQDSDIAGASAQHIGWYHQECAPSYVAMLEAIEGRIAAKTIDDKSSFATGLDRMCEHEWTGAPQKKQAAVLAKKLAADKTAHSFLRREALSAVHACDRAGGKAFVAKFTHDKESWVADRAKELLKEKRKK